MAEENETVRLEKAERYDAFLPKKAARLFKGLSFSAYAGDSVSVFSPNVLACTELVECLSFISRFSSGKYFLLGKDCSSLSGSQIVDLRFSLLGCMLKRGSLFVNETVDMNLAIRLSRSKKYISTEEKKKRIDLCLNKAGLFDFRNAIVSELSLFRQRLLSFASASVNSPSVLVADNPTFGLKSEEKKQFMDLLLSLCSDGTTVIVVTSVREEAERCKKALDI